MEDFQLRVVDEKRDLDAKIEKLGAFIFESEAYQSLSSVEQTRLGQQHAVMNSYSLILGSRIASFRKKPGPKEFRICVYGGRDFVTSWEHNKALQCIILRETGLDKSHDIEPVFVTGNAVGADAFGEAFAASIGARVEYHPPHWDIHGAKAGPIRNQEMVNSIIDLGIELPGGRGTTDMRQKLNRAGVTVVKLEEDPCFRKLI